MRILYGLSADGLGHAMRARVIAAHLSAQGHDVRLATSGRPAALLRRHGFSVVDVGGLSTHYEGGKVRRRETAWRALRDMPGRVRRNVRVLCEQAEAFAPELVLTDFSGFACALGHALDLPMVSIDHQHVVDRFHHPWRVVGGFAVDFVLARAVVRAKTPRCHRYIVTSFFFPAARDERATTLVGPVMRPEVERLNPTVADHVVVYQTAGGDPSLIPALRAVHGVPFHVYGHGSSGSTGNVTLRRFDEASFLDDLASARAVIANGGFTAISEALYFGKPVLSIPVPGQAEQQLNAAWLEHLGLGQHVQRLDGASVRGFLERLPSLQSSCDVRLRSGTRDALCEVDRALAEVA